MSDRFGQDHDELRAIMHRFAVHLRDGGGYDRASLSRERFAFSRIFGPHVVAEEQSLNALSTRPLTPQAARDVATYRDSLRDLRLDYSAHISVWTLEAIERDWPEYGRAVIALQRRLLDTMAWEERVIHPLIAHSLPQAA